MVTRSPVHLVLGDRANRSVSMNWIKCEKRTVQPYTRPLSNKAITKISRFFSQMVESQIGDLVDELMKKGKNEIIHGKDTEILITDKLK